MDDVARNNIKIFKKFLSVNHFNYKCHIIIYVKFKD